LELHDSWKKFLKPQKMRSTRQGSMRVETEEMTMQQVMGMMQGLQEAMAASKAEKECM